MPKYQVLLVRTVYENAVLDVEAADEYEAEGIALLFDEVITWHENDSDTEVVGIKEISK
jgi:hypothetical protein